ncbi:hypothetical protein CVT24_005834 [Panaeolus cyanescens]|uniref:Uncharacterized protein n=1 Tax=Panaeolus cyanescens TaxID=181874 RepID=A0A409V916_9AGAR|nr:hypothetical protein CVT24_005834 [Panaeolus cyanescens]
MIKYDWRKTDAHFGSAVLLGFSALLLLFTCLSSPVVETIYLYRISLKTTLNTRYVDVGLWGYCVERVKGLPVNDPNVVEGCSAARVGFSLDNVVATALASPQIAGLHKKSHTASLILYPIVSALLFFGCALQTCIHLSKRTRSMQISISSDGYKKIFIFNSITTFLVLIAFVLQISVVATAKFAIKDVTSVKPSVVFHWGNTVWLSVFPIIMLILDLGTIYTARKNVLRHEREEAAERMTAIAMKKQAKKERKKKPKAKKEASDVEQDNEQDNAPTGNDVGGSPAPPASQPVLGRRPTEPPPYDLDGYANTGRPGLSNPNAPS